MSSNLDRTTQRSSGAPHESDSGCPSCDYGLPTACTCEPIAPHYPTAIQGTWTDVERRARYLLATAGPLSDEYQMAEAVLVLLGQPQPASDPDAAEWITALERAEDKYGDEAPS